MVQTASLPKIILKKFYRVRTILTVSKLESLKLARFGHVSLFGRESRRRRILRLIFKSWSGRPGSNQRRPAWEAGNRRTIANNLLSIMFPRQLVRTIRTALSLAHLSYFRCFFLSTASRPLLVFFVISRSAVRIRRVAPVLQSLSEVKFAAANGLDKSSLRPFSGAEPDYFSGTIFPICRRATRAGNLLWT